MCVCVCICVEKNYIYKVFFASLYFVISSRTIIVQTNYPYGELYRSQSWPSRVP